MKQFYDNSIGLDPVKNKGVAMRNVDANIKFVDIIFILMVLAFLFATVFVTGTAMAETAKFLLDKNEEAFFTAPCPGETDLWCVAIKNDGPVESQLGYGFEKRPDDGTFQFFERANVKTVTIKAVFPKDLTKNWGITPSEAIVSTYNGKKLPKIKEATFSWFMRNDVSAELTVQKNAFGRMTFSEIKKKESSVNWMLIGVAFVMVMLGVFIGIESKKICFAIIASSILPSLAITAVIFSGANPTTWRALGFGATFCLLIPTSAVLAHFLYRRMGHKRFYDNSIGLNSENKRGEK